MTTINCSLDCEHQKEGKCTLDDADKPGTISDLCVYFSPAAQNKKTAKC
ncbi:MAG: hypothetical protein WCX81_07615 [Monoglobales bacterium]